MECESIMNQEHICQIFFAVFVCVGLMIALIAAHIVYTEAFGVFVFDVRQSASSLQAAKD